MKKLFLFHRNEKGFILPYSLLLSTIVLLSFITLISLYKNEQIITKRLLEQLQIESMIQMTYSLIEENGADYGEETVFTFPYGEVYMETVEKVDERIVVKMKAHSRSLTYTHYATFIVNG